MRLAINNNEKNYLAISFFFRDYVRHPFVDSGGWVITRRDGVGQGSLRLCLGRNFICRYPKDDAITLLT